MLRKHQISPYLAVLVITLVGSGLTYMMVQLINSADTVSAHDAAELPADFTTTLKR